MAQYQYPYQSVEWNSSHSFSEISECARFFGFRRMYYPYPGAFKTVSDDIATELDDYYGAHITIGALLLRART